MSKASQDDPVLHSAPLVEFLNTLPSPLTTTLVGLAPAISRSRHVLQILTWRAPREECWLALATWWAVCLVPELGLRYVLPLAVFLAFFRLRSNPATPQSPPPVTEDNIQRAIADLTTIHAILPSLPSLRPRTATIPPPLILLRAIATLYIPYLALTHLVRLRILLALTGTVILTWRSRWALVLRSALWRSAHLRWALYRAWSRLSGAPLHLVAPSPQAQSDATLASLSAPASAATKTTSAELALPPTTLRFLFTIYENQRWWMGLDWTAALLPNERPSWCSAAQQPAAPPSAFALPASTTAYTPAPDGSARRVKRTARWRWEEHEWRVVVRKEGAVASRVERPLPIAKEESAAAVSASRLLKAAGKMRAGSVDFGGAPPKSEKESAAKEDVGKAESESADGVVEEHPDEVAVEEPCTDADGWVYADNKWEGGSNKGGMGKYTRYRRWTRIAVLTETVEIVEPGPLGIQRDGEPFPPPTPTTASTVPIPGSAPASPVVSKLSITAAPEVQSPTSETIPHAQTATPAQTVESEGSRLTQRLKAAVKGATGHA